MEVTGKILIFIGIVIVALGILFLLGGNKLNWIGNLPGDINIKKENVRIFIPITTMILLSALVSFLWWLFSRFF
jgi:hypothetical protein